ncbi:MAG: RNA methyltransferase [Synechococcus lacustris]|jgi:hypothetical protein
MVKAPQLLISSLLRARVRDAAGLDLGVGHLAWMHPPCHRLLGWSTRPSAFGPRRTVWRLDQLLEIAEGELIVKGEPAETDQASLDLLPTLLDAELLGRDQRPLGRLVDAVVELRTGQILHYLVARSDPRLPGSSRWRLDPDRLLDQQPGQVISALQELDDLPLEKASIRQQVLSRTRRFRDQVPDSFDGLEDRLRSWGERLRDGGEELIDRWREDDDDRPQERPDRPKRADSDPWI